MQVIGHDNKSQRACMATFVFALHRVNYSTPTFQTLKSGLAINGRRRDMVDLIASAEAAFAKFPSAFLLSVAWFGHALDCAKGG